MHQLYRTCLGRVDQANVLKSAPRMVILWSEQSTDLLKKLLK